MIRRFARLALDGSPWAMEEGGAWRLLDAAPWCDGAPTDRVVAGDTALLAPVAPSKVIGIASNYRAHAAEMGKPVPSQPKIFLMPPTAIIGPGEAIPRPGASVRVDHEAELVAVIGRRAADVSVKSALEHVFGYTCGNDVTARDYQQADGVFARAKGFDGFAPAGPVVVQGLDPADVRVRGWVNGALRQDGRSSDMVFDVATLVSFVSHIMTLLPGDLIYTGTPAGVGPLVVGDVVDVEIDGIGRLSNPVHAR